jgi:hypothetical protein
MQYASGLLKEPIKAEDYTTWINKHKVKASAKPSSSSAAQQSNVNLQLF